MTVALTAILGAGVMGETLLSGLIRAGRRVDDLLVGEKRRERAEELQERYGVTVVDNVEAAQKADTVVIVVKPQDMADLLDEIAPVVRPGQLVVSLAAGITTAYIESRLPEGVAVVRVMPNTPALVDEGMAAISRGSHCDEEHLLEAESLMASIGRVLRVPEKQQDAVTAVSGSGPAYIFFVVESMIEAGVHLGLVRHGDEAGDEGAPAGMRALRRSTDHGRGPRSYRGLADVFGVYFPPGRSVYLVPINAVAECEGRLRLSPTRNNQKRGIRFAADFEIDRWSARDLEEAASAESGSVAPALL